jgi:hypothetical protein
VCFEVRYLSLSLTSSLCVLTFFMVIEILGNLITVILLYLFFILFLCCLRNWPSDCWCRALIYCCRRTGAFKATTYSLTALHFTRSLPSSIHNSSPQQSLHLSTKIPCRRELPNYSLCWYFVSDMKLCPLYRNFLLFRRSIEYRGHNESIVNEGKKKLK